MFLKEKVDDRATIRKICDILKPREFTRLDEIVDLVFTAAEEAAEPEAEIDEEKASDQGPAAPRAAPAAFHGACIARVEKHLGKQLIRQSKSSYATPDGTFAAVCAVSKTHDILGHPSYWFAFHPYQKASLENASEGLLILGCGSPEKIFTVPSKGLFTWLPDMWTTERDGRVYRHIRIHYDGTKYMMERKEGRGRIDITRYLLK